VLTGGRLAAAVPVAVILARWFPGLKQITLSYASIAEHNKQQGKTAPNKLSRYAAQYGMYGSTHVTHVYVCVYTIIIHLYRYGVYHRIAYGIMSHNYRHLFSN
jgi:hypothetical protein